MSTVSIRVMGSRKDVWDIVAAIQHGAYEKGRHVSLDISDEYRNHGGDGVRVYVTVHMDDNTPGKRHLKRP